MSDPALPAPAAESGGTAPAAESGGTAPAAESGGTAPAAESLRVRLTLAYDGTDFSGIAVQPGQPWVRTVGGALRGALEQVLRSPVGLTVAGRTDAGVHAWGQVVSFDAPAERFRPDSLQRSLNAMLGPEIVVRAVEQAPEGFDARRWAIARSYRYTVLNAPIVDPFRWRTVWHVPDRLDLPALRASADPLIGEHDFTSFCRALKGDASESLVRQVDDACWLDLGGGVLRFDIRASSFCQQMVRALVGTMVAMAAGRRRPGEMTAILAARHRATAERVAPPRGLCLWDVVYPADSQGPPAAEPRQVRT